MGQQDQGAGREQERAPRRKVLYGPLANAIAASKASLLSGGGGSQTSPMLPSIAGPAGAQVVSDGALQPQGPLSSLLLFHAHPGSAISVPSTFSLSSHTCTAATTVTGAAPEGTRGSLPSSTSMPPQPQQTHHQWGSSPDQGSRHSAHMLPKLQAPMQRASSTQLSLAALDGLGQIGPSSGSTQLPPVTGQMTVAALQAAQAAAESAAPPAAGLQRALANLRSMSDMGRATGPSSSSLRRSFGPARDVGNSGIVSREGHTTGDLRADAARLGGGGAGGGHGTSGGGAAALSGPGPAEGSGGSGGGAGGRGRALKPQSNSFNGTSNTCRSFSEMLAIVRDANEALAGVGSSRRSFNGHFSASFEQRAFGGRATAVSLTSIGVVGAGAEPAPGYGGNEGATSAQVRQTGARHPRLPD